MKIVDIHLHGGFGINFNTCSVEDVLFFAEKIKNEGISAFCPTLATDRIENIKRQIEIITEAIENKNATGAKILGIHLEALFLNPLKKGIHDERFLIDLTKENFEKLGDTKAIKIVTVAPELDVNLIKYLTSKNILVQAGHTLAKDIPMGTTSVCHHFNAMQKPNTPSWDNSISKKALSDNSLYSEIIADLRHNNRETLDMFFREKNHNKIILISDAIPIAHSNLDKVTFCNKEILKNGCDEKGTLGGSVMLLSDIVKLLIKENILSKEEIQKMVWDNPLKYLNIEASSIEC